MVKKFKKIGSMMDMRTVKTGLMNSAMMMDMLMMVT